MYPLFVQVLRLKELTVTGAGLPEASIRFAPGLNLIVGASDTGKTLIFEALDFMLGAGTPLRRIPESEGYDLVFLAIDPTGRPPFTVRRAYAGGQFEATEYQNGRTNPATATRTLKAAHNADPDDSLSAYVLRAIGMIRLQVRKNAAGDKKALSFRDVSHLTLVSEERVIQQSSPVLSGQYVLKTAERNTFAYFLTGQDDSQVIPQESTADRSARLNIETAIVEEMLTERRRELEAISSSPDELPDQIARLEEAVEQSSQMVVSTQEEIQGMTESRSSLFVKLSKAQARMIFLGEQLKRLRLLDQFYDSDRQRLLGVIEASKVLHEMPVGECPLCKQPFSGAGGGMGEHRAFEDACEKEIRKIDSLHRDLRIALVDFSSEEEQLRQEADAMSRQMGDFDHRLQRVLMPALNSARGNLQDLIRRRAVAAQGESIRTTVRSYEERLRRIEAERSESTGRQTFENRATTAEATELCSVVAGILRAWKYPNLGTVVFDTDKVDLVIGGQDRTNKGKGYRAITYAAFTIGLMRYCRMKNIPHPGFVVIDTPVNPFKGPASGSEDSLEEEVKVAFYEHLAADKSGDQVIIMENEPPPLSVINSVNYYFFSKNTNIGRYGFFPHRPAAVPAIALATQPEG